MGDFFYNSRLLTSYLLGELPAAEQDRFEEEYFCNNEVFTALLDAKDQLINDYLDGKLTDTERQLFERHFLTLPDRKREVELAFFFRSEPKPQVETALPIAERRLSLWQTVSRFVQSHQPQLGLVAAMLIVGSLMGWQMMHSSPEPNAVAIIQPSDIPEGQIVVPLFLKPIANVRSRSKQETTAEIGRATQTIDLNFEVGNEDFESYQGSIRNKQDGAEILSDSSLKATKNEDGKTIVNWQVPASRLQVSDYTVTLKGIAPDGSNPRVGDYDFEVRPAPSENSQPSK